MKSFILTYHAPVDGAWKTAESMEEARELCKDHPHLDWNAACEIVVHESLPVPGS